MLNAGVTPLLPKEGGEGVALAKAVLGAGSCLFKGEVRYEDSTCDGTRHFLFLYQFHAMSFQHQYATAAVVVVYGTSL